MTTPTTAQDERAALVAEAERLLNEITPGERTLLRYEHGGGRLFRNDGTGHRVIVADFYNEGDRELYATAPRLIQGLLAALASPAAAQVDTEKEQLRRDLAYFKERTAILERERAGEVWIWQGDAEDHLESLTCPVLIYAADLRALLAPADALSQEEWRWLEVMADDASKGRSRVYNGVGRSFAATITAKLRRLRPVVPGERNEQQNNEARVDILTPSQQPFDRRDERS